MLRFVLIQFTVSLMVVFVCFICCSYTDQLTDCEGMQFPFSAFKPLMCLIIGQELLIFAGETLTSDSLVFDHLELEGVLTYCSL